ncbi:UxaA family hydrolase [Oscillibacter sp.]|uniref:UxaA family hydrolase n=1 Tax=Oscillibacter sp. TaxID=1945593 RepID=UPI0028ADCF08|nr:UxaA family hydrolase [Oscillibacter sp.]
MDNAVVIDEKDNVAVVIKSVANGDFVNYTFEGKRTSLLARKDVSIYHKIAIKDIQKDEFVVKYGEHIGIALCNIEAGEHVHIHNLRGQREDLEAKA